LCYRGIIARDCCGDFLLRLLAAGGYRKKYEIKDDKNKEED